MVSNSASNSRIFEWLLTPKVISYRPKYEGEAAPASSVSVAKSGSVPIPSTRNRHTSGAPRGFPTCVCYDLRSLSRPRAVSSPFRVHNEAPDKEAEKEGATEKCRRKIIARSASVSSLALTHGTTSEALIAGTTPTSPTSRATRPATARTRSW